MAAEKLSKKDKSTKDKKKSKEGSKDAVTAPVVDKTAPAVNGDKSSKKKKKRKADELDNGGAAASDTEVSTALELSAQLSTSTVPRLSSTSCLLTWLDATPQTSKKAKGAEVEKEKKNKSKKKKKDKSSSKAEGATQSKSDTVVKSTGKDTLFKKNFYKESAVLSAKSASDIGSWRKAHVCRCES